MVKTLGFFLSLSVAAPALACTASAEPIATAEPHWKPWLEQVCSDCDAPVTLKDLSIRPGKLKNSPIVPSPLFRAEISGPPEVVKLSKIGDEQVLTALVNLLDTPERAYAANLLLVRMLKSPFELGEYSTAKPAIDRWWQIEGKTGLAKRRWLNVLAACSGELRWAPLANAFVSDNTACRSAKAH